MRRENESQPGSKAERAKLAEVKQIVYLMKKIMKSANEKVTVRESSEFQDFFGYIGIETDEEERGWMSEPKNLLLLELYVAELLARRGGKRKTMDTHGFELNLFENLVRLRDALWSGYYYPSRGTVHVIFDPVQREIFAAPYV